MAETLNQRIRDLRKAKGLTQLELAEKLNITDKAVSKWEANDGNPDISLLPKLAEIFCVTIDYLLTGVEPETVSLDDMDDKKRREFIIKKDDLKSFIKYGYDNSSEYYDHHWSVVGSSKHISILNSSFWNSIFKNRAYNIFSHCIEETINNCKESTSSYYFEISYIDIMTNHISDFMDFVIEHDRVDWLDALKFKFAKTVDDNNATFKTGKSVSNAVKSIFKNREKCPKCFKYILNIEHKSERKTWGSSKNWNWTFLDDLIIEECIKYKLYDEVISLFESFKNEPAEFYNDRDYYDRYSVSGSYILRTDPYADSSHIEARCVTATKEQIYQLIKDGNLSLVNELLDYNRGIIKVLKSKYLQSDSVFLMTEDEIQKAKIELDGKLTPLQRSKKIIEESCVLSIDELEELWKLSITESNLKTCIDFLKSKPLTYYEYFSGLIQNEDWKTIFEFAVDNEFDYAIKHLVKGNYDNGRTVILNLCLGDYEREVKKRYILNDNIFKFSSYRWNNKPEDVLKDLQQKGETFKQKWIEVKKAELARYNLTKKMNNISNDISEDYIKDELSKGNVELVIIKLCSRLEAQLSIKYNREDDLFNLLNEFCEKELHREEYDYDWEEYRTVADDEQIKLLNKLRMNRNNIAHPQKDVEILTLDELEKCIDYVFKI